MSRSRLTVFLSLVLTVCCWLGGIVPVRAQTLVTQPYIVASGGTPVFKFSGNRPANLGVTNGKLLACPASPNCVNSQTDATDAEHSIAPLTYTSDPTTAWATLKTIVQGMERAKIISETSDYLYAEFTSKLMGFVDDVEFYLDANASVIQVRSASRLGQSDLGVNRKRVEEIRPKLAG
jgi:uncharacterized protein (DUF1499 family)